MVTLPREFTATKFPGYFWNIDTQSLFSIKISGKLRELKLLQPNYWNRWVEPGYRISHKGHKRILRLSYLEKLILENSEISYAKK